MRERYEGYIAGYEACYSRFRKFAGRVSYLFGVKALRGCQDANWDGFCNGNGTEVGHDIDALVVAAQKLARK